MSSVPESPTQVYYRKVIRITAEDSPNVRYAQAEIKAGKAPSGKMLVPGVLPYDEYVKRRQTWDKIRQTVGMDALFYEGKEVLMYPPLWLDRAHRIAHLLNRRGGEGKASRAIGVDPGEGVAETSICVIDHLGILELLAKVSEDTSEIIEDIIIVMNKWDVDPGRVILDRGGGGKIHAHFLRKRGYKVRTVSFGESLAMDPKRGLRRVDERVDNRELKYTYVNRRAEMYGDLRILLDPSMEDMGQPGFGIPAEYVELRRQLSPIPLLYDAEGRIKMLPKNKRNPTSKEETLTELLGCSPDQADSLVLAVHALVYKTTKVIVGSGRRHTGQPSPDRRRRKHRR